VAMLVVMLLSTACSTRSVSEIKPRVSDDASAVESSPTDADADADTDTGTDASASACYLTTLDVSNGEEPVACSLPHVAEIIATVRPVAAGSTYPGAAALRDQGTGACADAFRDLTDVAIETAIPSLVVVFPDETGWSGGNRTIACVLEFPRALSEALADLDPRRALGLASFYGLETGDCLRSLDQSEGALVLVGCEQPHSIEVFDVLTIDDATYPGDIEVDTQALDHCFSEFENLYGVAESVDDAPFDYLVPTEQSWTDYDDRAIICVAAVNPGT